MEVYNDENKLAIITAKNCFDLTKKIDNSLKYDIDCIIRNKRVFSQTKQD